MKPLSSSAHAPAMVAGRISGNAFKDARHVALIGKTGIRRNFSERFAGFDNPPGHMLDARAQQRIGDRTAAKTPERAAQMRGMHPGLPCDGRNIDRFLEALADDAV